MRTGKSILEKQSQGVLSGVQIAWASTGGAALASNYLHGAGLIQPWSKQELTEELYFLAEVAAVKASMERGAA